MLGRWGRIDGYDASNLKVQFDDVEGQILAKGGYNIIVTMPYHYNLGQHDDLADVIHQEYKRIKTQLKNTFTAMTYNPQRNSGELPPPGTIINRQLLVRFKGKYPFQKLKPSGEITTQFTIEHQFEEDGKIILNINESLLKKIGGEVELCFNDLGIKGGTNLENHSEKGIQLTIDVNQSGEGDETLKEVEAARRLLAETVRFSEKGLPQAINYRVCENLRNIERYVRITKQLDASIGARYSFGAVGLSTGRDKKIQTVYETRQNGANRKEINKNLSVWTQAAEKENLSECSKFIGKLRRGDRVAGAIFKASARNEEAIKLTAKLGKSLGTEYVQLEASINFGKQIKNCSVIERRMQISPDQGSATLTFDALNSKKFLNTIMDFVVGLKVQSALKNTIGQYSENIIGQIEDSFCAGRWLENLDLKTKVGDQLYNIIRENVEKIACTISVTSEHDNWGRIIFQVSGIRPNPDHDILCAKMMSGDFSDAVASGLHLSTNIINREEFKSKIEFDFVGLLTYSMLRSRDVIDEIKVWEFGGKKFQVNEMSGDVTKDVDGINKTDFRVRTYYINSVGDDGRPIPNIPQQAITTVVYSSKEYRVSSDPEAKSLVGMAQALKFHTFVPLEPKQTMGGGTIEIAAAISTEGHIKAIKRTPEEAQKIGRATARAVLQIGDSMTPMLAAQLYDINGKTLSERLEIAEFIKMCFAELKFDTFASIGWNLNNRIDPEEVEKVRGKIKTYLKKPHRSWKSSNQGQVDIEYIKQILPQGGVSALSDDFILSAGSEAILDRILNLSEDEQTVEAAIYERTFNRKIKHERFVREMGQWAMSVSDDQDVVALRQRLMRGVSPKNNEIHALLAGFVEMGSENTQSSTAIFGDAKDLQSLVRWTILHAMAGEENFIGFVKLKAEEGSFIAGTSQELTPVRIEDKWQELQDLIGKTKVGLDNEAHGAISLKTKPSH